MEKKRESNSGNMCFREGVLPNDLWRYIGLKLDSAADRIRFRAVSKTWMSLVPFCQPPWLMLAEQEEAAPISPPLRGFVCLGEQNTHLFDLPDLHQARCVGSTGNWLATIHLDKSIRLLNPFTRHQFHLPPVSAFDYKLDSCESPPDLYRDSFVWKIVLSSSPPDWVAVAVHHHYRVLAFARPQCASWTTIPLAGSRNLGMIGIQDMIFYNHKLYAITFDARLMACDIPLAADDDAPKLSFLTDRFLRPYYKQKCYLVECRGELLLVIKFVESSLHLEDPKVQDPIYATKSFQVYKFDSSADIKFTELKSLGEYSLFLGFSTSVSVLASDYFGFVRNNSIYFTDDYTHGYRGTDTAGGHDMGVFDLEDATITPHYKGVSTSLYSPPVWIVPA